MKRKDRASFELYGNLAVGNSQNPADEYLSRLQYDRIFGGQSVWKYEETRGADKEEAESALDSLFAGHVLMKVSPGVAEPVSIQDQSRLVGEG